MKSTLQKQTKLTAKVKAKEALPTIEPSTSYFWHHVRSC